MDEAKFIIRQNLIQLLRNSEYSEIIYLCAPAGYGKTTLIRQYIKLKGLKSIYYQIPHDAKYSYLSFIKFLITKSYLSKTILNNELKKIEENLDYEPDPTNLVGVLVSELLKLGEKVYFIIDDLHNLKLENWFYDFIKEFISKSEGKINVILASRFEADDKLAVLEAAGNLSVIGKSELQTKTREVVELAKSLYGVELNLSSAEEINQKVEGWITGHHFLLKEFIRTNSTNFSDIVLPKMTYYYLANEIIKDLEPRYKDFLLTAGFLDRFSGKELEEIFGIPNSTKILSYLLKRNLYLEVIEEGKNELDTVYKFVDLFKDFLAERIEEVYSQKERNKFNNKISSYFQSKGRIKSAAIYAARAGNNRKLKSIIKNNYRDFFDDYNFELMRNWIDLIGQEQVLNDPVLLFCEGELNYKFHHNLDESENYFREAFKKAKNKKFRYEVLLSLLNLLLAKIKMNDVIELVDDEIKFTRSNELKAKLLKYKALANYQILDLPSSIRIFEQATKSAEAASDQEELNIIRLQLARSYYYVMKLDECLESLNIVNTNDLTLHNQFIRWKSENELFMTCRYNLDRFDYTFLKMKEIYIDHKIDSVRRKYFDALAEYYVVGDFETAEENYKKLCNLTENKTEYFNYYTHLTLMNYFLKDLDASRESFRLAKKYFDEDFVYTALSLEWAKGCLYILEKKHGLAEKQLRKTMEKYEELGILYGVFILGQDLMRALLLQNKPDEALEVWQKIEPIVHKIQPSSFEMLRLLYDRDIMDFLLINGIYTPNFILLYQMIDKLNTFQFVSDGYKKRLPTLQSAAIDIKLNTFGSIEIFIRGKKIEDKAFQYKKWKVVLVYILINFEKGLTKDEIISKFFENMSAKSANSKFHQLISNFRKVLTPEIESDGYFQQNPFSFIDYSNNLIQLREKFNYNFDVSKILHVHNNLLNCDGESAECIDEMKSALIKFSGVFMKGVYDDWVEDLRDRLSIVYDDLYEALMKILKEQHINEEIIHFSELKIANDPTYDNAHMNSIKAEISLHNLSKARRKKERLIKIMSKNELMSPELQKRIDNLSI